MDILSRHGKSVFLFFILFTCNFAFSQVNIFTESFDEPNGSTSGLSDEGVAWSRDCPTCPNTGYFEVVNGTFENNNTDAPATWTTDPIDISNCSRIEFQVSYSGEPFAGSGNLESNDECNMNGPCLGDVNMPNAGGCFNCWDFMDFNLIIDGVSNDVALVGTVNTPDAAVYTYEDEECPSVGNEVIIEVATQTWAAAEFMRFDNVILVCFDDGGLSASITGGNDLCPGECSDVGYQITGGEAPYDIDVSFSIGALVIPVSLNNLPAMGTIEVCYDVLIPIPFFEPSTNTLFVNDDFGTFTSLEINAIEDNTGCFVNLSDLTVEIELFPGVTIFGIPDIQLCSDDSGSGTIDLSDYDDDISPGNVVTWFSDIDLMNQIGPIYTITESVSIYAVATNGFGCSSGGLFVDVILNQGPVFTGLMDIMSCGEYELPIIQGDNLNNPAYYSMPDGGGIQYDPGDIIDFNTILYVFDENNDCISEESFTITILPTPEIDPVISVTACGSYTLPPITGNNIGPFPLYYTLPGGMGVSFQPGDVITTSQILYAYDSNGNCSDEELFTVLISQAPDFDPLNNLTGCGCLELPELTGTNLTGNEAYYLSPNGTGDSYQAGDTICSSNLIYAYDAIGDCSIEVQLFVTLSDGPELGVINDILDCEYVVLPDIPYTDDGQNYTVYYSSSGETINPGDTIFETTSGIEYFIEVTGNPDCFQSADFDVTIVEPLQIGSSDTISTCAGAEIYLYNLLDQDTNQNGEFLDLDGSAAIINDTLFTNLISADSINLRYLISNECGTDSIELLIELVTEANAGNDQLLELCEGAIIDPSAFIDGDPGGTFYNADNGMEFTGEIETEGMTNDIIDLIYVVGGGGNCVADTSLFSVEVVQNPEFDAQPVFKACDMFVLPIIDGTGLDGSEAYYTEPFGEGEIIASGETITDSVKLYLFIENQFCFAQDSMIIHIGKSETVNLNPTLCPSDSVVVNGVTYNINQQAGTQELKNVAGCDSFVVVNLNFIIPDTNHIESTLCYGESIIVNNTLYDEANPSGMEVLEGMAIDGCDSIIQVNLEFSDAAVTPINEMICLNDSININGIFYSVNNPSGQDTIPTGGGCDSILDINIDFFPEPIGNYTEELCPGQSVNIGGIEFDEDNPNGNAIISGGSSNGCDSLVMVNLIFGSAPEGDLDTIICESDAIVIEGEIFDVNNIEGVVTIENSGSGGCDSIVNVSLDFYEIEEGFYTETYCAGESVELFGETFDENNPEQLVVLQGASAQNCDSTVLVSLEFEAAAEGLLMESICNGSTISINGDIYDENNTSGQFITQTADGCDSIVNVLISILDVSVNLDVISIDCPDENNTDEIAYVIFNGMNFSSANYSYMNGNTTSFQSISIGDTIFYNQAGIDALVFQNDQGCIAETSVTIVEPSELALDLPEIQIVPEGNSVTLNINVPDNSMINWTPSFNISCTDCSNPVISPDEDTQYIVDVTSPSGCIVSDTILIRVEESIDIYVPNIFTPDNNGINDVFFVSSDTDFEYDLFIFDRWGNKMFEGRELKSNNSLSGWDGLYNGSKVKPGVYVYYFEYTIEDEDGNENTELISGDITIIN